MLDVSNAGVIEYVAVGLAALRSLRSACPPRLFSWSPTWPALRDVIKTWSLYCSSPIATLKVVSVGQSGAAALVTARDLAVWMAAQQGRAILVACHDGAEVIASSYLDH